MTEKQEKAPPISESDPVFKLMLDLSPIGFVIFDVEGRAIYANPRAEQLFGKTNKALAELRCGDFMPGPQGRTKTDTCGPSESSPDCQLFQALCAILEGRPQPAPVEGEAFLESVPGQPAVRVKYKVDGIVLNGRKAAVLAIDDISELHRKEQILFKSEQYFQRMFERAPLGYQSLDEQGRFIEVNEAWLETLGYQREEVIGKWFGDFLAPEFVAAFRERFSIFKASGRIHSGYARDEILKLGIADLDANGTADEIKAHLQNARLNGSEIFETRHRRKDGTFIDVEMSVTYLDVQGGQFICFCRDITERKQAEERERHLTKVLRAIRNVNQLIVSEDDSLRLIERACAELTGTMGYFSAWIALLREDRSIIATAGSGFAAGFGELRKHLENGAFCDCMNHALAREEIIVELAPQTRCPECPLSGHYGGMAAFGRRLAFDGKVYGFLSASLPVASAQDAEEKGLFEELANDLAFALHRIASAKALRESQQDMKRAQSMVQIGSWRFDLSSGMVIASEVTRRIYGLDNSQWTIARVQNIPLPQYREALNAELKNLIHRGRPYNIEFQIQRPSDQAVRYIRSVAEYDAERNIVIGTLQDITESKQAQEALKRIEARQRKMVANIGDVIVIIDQNGINRYKSPNIEKFFGWRPEEVVGVSAWENVHPEDLNGVLALFNLLIGEANATATTQCRYRCKDGSYRWIEFTGVNLLHDPDIRGVLGNYKDITERMQAEAQLQKSHDLLSNLARLVPGVIYQYRLYPDGRAAIPYASPGMHEISEFSPEEVRQDAAPLFERLHPDDRDRVTAAILESARTLEMFYCEFRVVLPRQGLRWRVAQAKPQRMEDGGTLWHGIISDITERKKNEEERSKLQEQLQQSQKMESVGRLAGGVAHDYNNMLSVILGYTEMALDKVQPQHPLHADLTEILKAATRSSNITRQLLAFARKQTIAPKVVDLNAVVESMLKMLRRLIGEDIDLDWRPGNPLWAVKIDPAQVDQILANLCVNARDAIEGVGKVTIETGNAVFDEAYCAVHAGYSVGEYVSLTVSDDGCGMTQEILNNLFEPFFTTKAVTEGTGLGLATIYGIVKQNNGFINVYSEPGQGSTFKIYLPRQAATQRPAGIASQAQTPVSRGETVLLVEDEPAIMRMAQIMLRSLGYRVIAAGTPSLAIALAREHGAELELLLTDVVMPEMNGRELTRQISALCPGVKTLFMSGYTANVIAHHGVLEEGMDFIQKPFSMNELGIKIRVVLDRQMTAP